MVTWPVPGSLKLRLVMNLLRIVFAALIGLFSSSMFVLSEETKEAQNISTESAVKQYVVTFHDEVTPADFSEVSKWITDNNGQIVESINENFAKLIIAKSDPSILKLSELKPTAVESVEEDDLDWYEHADL